MKAATVCLIEFFLLCIISIHAAREGGDMMYLDENGNEIISIHAAREGGDVDSPSNSRGERISIHAAREGGDHSHRRDVI